MPGCSPSCSSCALAWVRYFWLSPITFLTRVGRLPYVVFASTSPFCFVPGYYCFSFQSSSEQKPFIPGCARTLRPITRFPPNSLCSPCPGFISWQPLLLLCGFFSHAACAIGLFSRTKPEPPCLLIA